MRRPNPPVVSDLACTLEELFQGKSKHIKITRKRRRPDGSLSPESKELTIDIRQGWKAGTKITFPGESDESSDPSMKPADVVFVIQEKPHAVFKRNGNDLILSAKIPLKDALCGAAVQLQTLEGKNIRIRVPEDTIVYPGYEMVVPGQGMPITKRLPERGNLIVQFQVDFPKHLSAEQKTKVMQAL